MNNREMRELAKKMRMEGNTLTEICKTLNKSKATVHYWIKEIPYTPNKRTSKQKNSQIKASIAMQQKYKNLRDEAYQEFWNKKNELLSDIFLRDFVNIYLTEGYRRDRNCVAVANSNPKIIKISYYFIKKFTTNKIQFSLQHHEDQDVNYLLDFWSNNLNINPTDIKITRKSNSGKLEGRVWNSQYGVFTVRSCDTYLRAKIQALMDVVENEWEENFSFENETSTIPTNVEESISNRKVKNRPSKEELLELILNKSFLQIGKDFGVSDNAIRKWCKSYDLPYRKKDIEEYKNNYLVTTK